MRRERSVQLSVGDATRHINPRVHLRKCGTSRNSHPQVFIRTSGHDLPEAANAAPRFRKIIAPCPTARSAGRSRASARSGPVGYPHRLSSQRKRAGSCLGAGAGPLPVTWHAEGSAVELSEPGEFRVLRLPDVPVLVCPPEVDVASHGDFEAALAVAEQAAPTVVVDLTGTTFCDCSGLRPLVPAQQRVRARGGLIRLVTSSAVIGLLLLVIGLEGGSPRHRSVADAVRATLAGRDGSARPCWNGARRGIRAPGGSARTVRRRWYTSTGATQRKPVGRGCGCGGEPAREDRAGHRPDPGRRPRRGAAPVRGGTEAFAAWSDEPICATACGGRGLFGPFGDRHPVP